MSPSKADSFVVLHAKLVAHDYETHYALIAEHFNELRLPFPMLVRAAA